MRIALTILVAIWMTGCGAGPIDKSMTLPPSADGGSLPLKTRAMLYFPDSQRDRPLTSLRDGNRLPTGVIEGRALMAGAGDAFRRLFAVSDVNAPAIVPQVVIVLEARANWDWAQDRHETRVTALIVDVEGNVLGRYAGTGRMGSSQFGRGAHPVALEGSFYAASFEAASLMARDATLLRTLRVLERDPALAVPEGYLRTLDLPSSAWAGKDRPLLRP